MRVVFTSLYVFIGLNSVVVDDIIRSPEKAPQPKRKQTDAVQNAPAWLLTSHDGSPTRNIPTLPINAYRDLPHLPIQKGSSNEIYMLDDHHYIILIYIHIQLCDKAGTM